MRLARAALFVTTALLLACTPVATDPDAGHITFGESVDMTTYVLSGGPASAFDLGSDVAYRAAMPRVMGGPTTIRLVGTLNDVQILNTTDDVTVASWSLYVGTIPAGLLFETGQFEMKIVDVGNNELASGRFTVR